jgi:hypothetical protein
VSAERTPRDARLAALVVVALLLGLAAWSVVALQPPEPRPADAPATEFSAERAFAHVQQIAAETHVTGSAANDRVVEGLVRTLTDLGLDTRVQNSVGARAYGEGEARMARVRNVVAVLPGTEPTGRIFLTAHHDSVETGPGAADDAAGVAALLEAVRALTMSDPLRNDVVVVLTDAEEACLCGAEAFAEVHPLAGGGGVVLNFEARGTTGPPITFQTTPGNAGLVDTYAAAAVHPVATSAAVEVYRVMPNTTDFTMLTAHEGFAGLDTAFVDGSAAYHTPQDVPARLDRGTLQALGDNALALARELGGRDLAPLKQPGADDATYFPVLGELVRYPERWVLPVAAAGLVGVLLLAVVAARQGKSSLGRTAAGTVLTLIPLAAAPLAAQGLWWLLGVVRPGYRQMLDPWQPGWYRLATVALVAAVVLTWYVALRRGVGAVPLAVGALLWPAVLGVVLAFVAPGASYLLAVPALAGGLAGLLAVLTPWRTTRLLAALLGGAVAVVVLAPTAALFFPTLGLRVAAAPALVTTVALLVLLPAVEQLLPTGDPVRRSGTAVVPTVAAALAVAGALVGLAADRFDAEHPVPTRLAYVLDSDRDEAWWASTEDLPGAWTAPYVQGGEALPDSYPYLTGDVHTGPAQPAALVPAVVTTVSDSVVGERREVTVLVTPQRPDVRFVTLDLSVDRGAVVGGRIAGRAVPADALAGERLQVTFHAPPPGGLQASFSLTGDGAVVLRTVEGSTGLAGLPGFSPRPEGVDVAGSHSADLVLVSATTDLGLLQREG